MKLPPPTIPTVYNTSTGMTEEATHLLRDEKEREAEIFQLRTEIEFAIQHGKPKLVCLYCKQPVALRGQNNRRHFYFTHLKNSQDCVIKTLHKLSEDEIRRIKYNGSKESAVHIELKNFIGDQLALEPDVTEVKVDQVYRDQPTDRQWRKPDVAAVYKGMHIAFELQLTTTFLSVIVSRTIFYQERGVFLIWVFSKFSLESELQKFTEKDVFYNNNYNVYVLDDEAQTASAQSGRLKLTCYFKEFHTSGEKLDSTWKRQVIGLEDLAFKTHPSSVCFHDSETQRLSVIKLIDDLRVARAEQERLARIALEQEKEQKAGNVNDRSSQEVSPGLLPLRYHPATRVYFVAS